MRIAPRAICSIFLLYQCMGKIFRVEFQRETLKFHTKYLTHTLKDMIFVRSWILRALGIKSLYVFLKCPPGVVKVVDPVEAYTETGVRLTGGQDLDVDMIVLATGYRSNYKFIDVPCIKGVYLAGYTVSGSEHVSVARFKPSHYPLRVLLYWGVFYWTSKSAISVKKGVFRPKSAKIGCFQTWVLVHGISRKIVKFNTFLRNAF